MLLWNIHNLVTSFICFFFFIFAPMNKITKIQLAVRQVLNGKPISSVSEEFGIDRKTISLYHSRYHSEGNKAFQKQTYSLKTKKEIVLRHINNGTSIPLLSSEYGIPDTTIRRWVNSSQKYGKLGLTDKRRKSNRRHYRICKIVYESINMTSKHFTTDFVKRFDAFKDSGFITFLYYLSKMSIRIIEDKYRGYKNLLDFTNEELDLIYGGARLAFFFTVPSEERKKTEEILKHFEGEFYTIVFIEKVCKVYKKICLRHSIERLGL